MKRSAWHPLEIESRWDAYEDRCLQFLSDNIPARLAPLFGLVLAAGLVLFIDLLKFPAPNRGFLEMIRAGAWAIWTLLIIAALSPWWSAWLPRPSATQRSSIEVGVFFALASLCWIISIETQAQSFYSNPQTLRDLAWVYLLFPAWIAIGLFLTQSALSRLRSSTKWLLSSLFLVLPFSTSMLALHLTQQDHNHLLFTIWGPRPHTYVFLIATLLFLKRSSPPAIVANPIHVLIPTLYPIETSHLHRRDSEWMTNWWKGFLGVAKSLLMCWFVMSILKLAFTDIGEYVKNWRPLIAPVFAIFASITVVLFQVGVSRMLGVKTVDGTYFSVFAKSPLEYWKRDGVYPYQFALRFVFFPTLRLFRMPALALLAAGSVFLINRVLFYGLILTPLHFLVNDQIQSVPFSTNMYRIPVFFLGVLLTVKFWFSRETLEASAARAWLAILITHLLNAVADWILFYRS